MIVAKPVVEKQYWILKKDDAKIGQIEAQDGEYTVKIQGQVTRYKTIRMAGRAANIQFEKLTRSKNTATNQVYGFTVLGRVFNPVWDVKHRIPLFTKENKSKSWFAAGWYGVKQHRKWKIVQNPKLITLQRYSWQGPYHTKKEADESVS
jgi:hypothetical protein